ncbi:hypothetical protein [Salinigranum halophilum]|uniref:hypothetical protein n=1 Tax=Salinigranum halophilum TaxID=2565931 RepID=UPI0010A79FFD|nr:hypothetical protein [Salinigranum halophilum]
MTSRFTRGVHLTTGVVTVLLAIPVLGVLLWGAWRLLFWGVVAAAPHAQYGAAAGMPAPSAMPPGVDTMVVGGTLSGAGGSLTLLAVGSLVLVVLLLVAPSVTARVGDGPAPPGETSVPGEADDEDAPRPRRTLTGGRAGRLP